MAATPVANQESTAPVIQNYYSAPQPTAPPPPTLPPAWGMPPGYPNHPYAGFGYMHPLSQAALLQQDTASNAATEQQSNVPLPPAPAPSSPIQPSLAGSDVLAAYASHILRSELQPARLEAIQNAFVTISEEFLRLEDVRGHAGEETLMRLGVKSGIAKVISNGVSSFKANFKNEQVARSLLELANRAPFNGGARGGGVVGQDSGD